MKKKMILQALEMFYIDNLTQKTIGQKMGVSRSTIIRLLAEGRKNDYIEINIRDPDRKYILLEKELIRKYNIKEAYIVSSGWKDELTKKNTAQMCAELLMKKIKPNMNISVSGGSTLHMVASHLHSLSLEGVNIVSLHGSLIERGSKNNPVNVASDFAEKLNAECFYFNSPAMVDSSELKELIMTSASFNRSRENILNSSIALIGAGGLGGNHSKMVTELFENGEELIEEALDAGACGEVLGYYINPDGNLVDCRINSRIVSISLSELAHIDNVIIVGGGSEKVTVFGSLLKKGINSIFISDSDTAEAILDL